MFPVVVKIQVTQEHGYMHIKVRKLKYVGWLDFVQLVQRIQML